MDGGDELHEMVVSSVLRTNGVPHLLRMLNHHSSSPASGAVLSRFMVFSTEAARAVLDAGAMDVVLAFLGTDGRADNPEIMGGHVMTMMGLVAIGQSAPLVDAGAVPFLASVVRDGNDAEDLAIIKTGITGLLMFIGSAPDTLDTVLEAGGIGEVVRSLKRRLDAEIVTLSISFLHDMSKGNAAVARQTVDGGGVRALMKALHLRGEGGVSDLAAGALLNLMIHGHADEVSHADRRTGALAQRLEQRPSTPQLDWAIGKLEAGRRKCANPGCGATEGLQRCARCLCVYYCGMACHRAHWPQHRPECTT